MEGGPDGLNPAEAPLPLLVMQTIGSAVAVASAASYGWTWFAWPMAAFWAWSACMLARRIIDRR